jgi:small nuclear ribonucleoprotein (snRNP)-like protein
MSVPRYREIQVYMILTVLKAYDSHCNLVLGDVEETIYMVDEDDEDEETVKVTGADFP